MKKIFMDYSSTTPVDKEVIESMIPYFNNYYGNASSIHSLGIDAYNAIEKSREKVAELLSSETEEIIFTSSGTESDNLAIKGIANQNKNKKKYKGPHIITSSIEHPAVLETCKYLEKNGFNIKYLPVDKYGIVNIKDLENSISKNTFLITIMHANNEIGTIEPIEKIGQIAKEKDIIFHTDAVQTVGKVPISVKKINVDLLSISAHKFYGPKGVGALYIRNDIKLEPITHGGGHEKGLRSSTYNTPGIVGLGKTCELAKERMEKDSLRIKKLRDRLIKETLKIDKSYLNGHPEKRLINNAHFRFEAIEGESLSLMLDNKGIAASTGSACSSRKIQTSHVLTAIGLPPEEAHGSLRLTLGKHNTYKEIERVKVILSEVIEKLRKMSPLWTL